MPTNLVMTRVFDAPIEEVWKAWSEAERIKQWWSPEHFTNPMAKMDFREGGTSLIAMRSPQGQDFYSTWHYRKIVPMQEIEYIHNLSDPNGNKIDPTTMGMPPDFPQEQLNRVTFRDLGSSRTEVTVTEYDWTEGQMLDMSRLGLEQTLDKLAATFTKTGK